MKLSSSKKIAILGVILLILAGLIVVALKGMNVDLMLKQHKSMNIVIGKEFEIKDIQKICEEIFIDKDVVLKKIEVFGDAVSVNTISITDEEKVNLISKINEKYGTNLIAEDITVNSNSNIRIRDMIKPYILPLGISAIVIYVYIAFILRKKEPVKSLLEITSIILLTEVIITSVIAITRIPVAPIIVNIMFIVAIAEIIIFLYKKENSIKIETVEKN